MPELLTITPETIQRAAHCLRDGGLVAFPTETVYGLGANALDGRAVARIFETKGRPQFNPLIVHVSELAQVETFAHFNEQAQRLAEIFWPGPLTLVLARRAGSGLSELVSAGLPTVAIRVPSHPAARNLIAASGAPVAAPSANPSGQVSPTQAAHVAADLGSKVDMILDGGQCKAGLESTIIALTGDTPTLLRAGSLAREAIEDALGEPLSRRTHGATPQAPGMLTSHYAPRAYLRLNAEFPQPGDAFLGFGSITGQSSDKVLNLSASGNLREAAANLFSSLRELDATGARTISIAPIPEHGLGEAINDRLRRAAAPRPEPARSD
ncbi:MAG: threonylcarbamoyl-AMP synthase [Hyphomicrobiales bacterium]|nr:threonylcarbamoyl-AMP synthase [Hyphomicrobiales bacterium]